MSRTQTGTGASETQSRTGLTWPSPDLRTLLTVIRSALRPHQLPFSTCFCRALVCVVHHVTTGDLERLTPLRPPPPPPFPPSVPDDDSERRTRSEINVSAGLPFHRGLMILSTEDTVSDVWSFACCTSDGVYSLLSGRQKAKFRFEW